MTTYNYDSNVPAANHSPKNDQGQMQTNAASISSLIGIDHIGFNVPSGGYHNIIHQAPQAADPATVAGVGQIYTKTVSGDQQLFYESGNGIINQLSFINTSSSAIENGYIWIGGVILMQWGRVSSTTNSSGTVTFPTAFPTACLNIECTPNYSSSLPSSQVCVIINRTSTPTTTTFKWNRITNSGQSTGFYWFAIGN